MFALFDYSLSNNLFWPVQGLNKRLTEIKRQTILTSDTTVSMKGTEICHYFYRNLPDGEDSQGHCNVYGGRC